MNRVLLITKNLILMLSGMAILAAAQAGIGFAQPLLDPMTQPQFVNPLPEPSVLTGTYHHITMTQFEQDLGLLDPLTGAPLMTTVWGYNGTYPGPTIEAERGVPIDITWTNDLVDPSTGAPLTHFLPVDQTLHWADPFGVGHSMDPYYGPVPTVVHLHGGETEPESDGHPDAWFTPGFVIKGEGWMKDTYRYHNEQPPTTLWYHDHALGITRLNVYAGLAGFYLLRDPEFEEDLGLPSGEYEREVVIQDRLFHADGSLAYPSVGINPEHPYWTPEFFGDFIVVNGKVWPYMEVEPRKYRFRLLNGSNARFYDLKLVDFANGFPGPAFNQIGTDGGYLAQPVLLNDPANPNSQSLVIAPGERADIIIDFAGFAAGTQFLMTNKAKSPYPKGASVNPRTTGRVMLFKVVEPTGTDNSQIAAGNTITPLSGPVATRLLTLNEVMGANGPLAMFLDGKMWDGTITETPTLGSTEVWDIVNMTADTHPIHLHLVQFQLISRQKIRVNRYIKDYALLNPVIPADVTYNPPIGPYLVGQPSPPDANETGWKDTFRMNPGEVSRIIVRFAPIGETEVTDYPFDATAEPGYVWHCHILEHEDNEMMRPYKLQEAIGPMVAGTREMELEYPVLAQNHPNPFSGETEIRFVLPASRDVELKVYNESGQVVTVLADGLYGPGIHSVKWDGTSRTGSRMPNGVYFYRMRSGDYSDVKKTLLIR